jgi:Protein of unknown function (DUF732)
MTSTRVGKRTRLPLRLATRLVAVAVALLGPLGATPTAHADAADDAFLAILQSDSITDDSREAAIEAAHKVCEYLDQGKTLDQVVYDVVFSSHLPAYDSGFFVGASTRTYCPQHAPQT